jgi:hypothetical protein
METTPDLPPPLQLFRMVTGYYVSRALYVVATLGVADRLANGPRGHEELAKETATHAPALRRVLRLLASVGVQRRTRLALRAHADRRLPA